jgi:predicted DNA-binding antitoxin AbrB/MazE fold protein
MFKMEKNILNGLLKQNTPINFIEGKDIRVVIQDDDIQNEGWKSDIKAIKLLIDELPVGFIQKDTEDFLINEKIAFLLLNSIAELLKDNDPIGFIRNQNNMEVIHYFIELVSDQKWESNPDFQEFI